jgi:Tfp pilus assembly protein PilF
MAAYSEFETKALSAMNTENNANKELVFYYLGPGKKPAEALRIAEQEAGKRHDVYTLDAYAWALCNNGRYDEAQKQISSALAVGISDAEMLYHAGVIAEKHREYNSAVRYLKGSLELDPSSEVSREARDALSKSMSVPVLASNTH